MVFPLACPDNKFRCNDGQCIPSDDRCDVITQCTDDSDEEDCRECCMFPAGCGFWPINSFHTNSVGLVNYNINFFHTNSLFWFTITLTPSTLTAYNLYRLLANSRFLQILNFVFHL